MTCCWWILNVQNSRWQPEKHKTIYHWRVVTLYKSPPPTPPHHFFPGKNFKIWLLLHLIINTNGMPLEVEVCLSMLTISLTVSFCVAFLQSDNHSIAYKLTCTNISISVPYLLEKRRGRSPSFNSCNYRQEKILVGYFFIVENLGEFKKWPDQQLKIFCG